MPRPAVRVLHAGDAAGGARRCSTRCPTRARTRSATTWPATSAAARATSASSRRCGRAAAQTLREARADDRPLRRRARACASRIRASCAGRGVYLDDIEPPGTLHVAFCRSPHAHARIVSVDASRARALDGVALVVSGEDLRDLPPFSTTIATRPEAKTGTRHMLPLDRVRFVGEAVAAVVGTLARRRRGRCRADRRRVRAPARRARRRGGARARRAGAARRARRQQLRAHRVRGGRRRRRVRRGRARLPQALPLRSHARGAARGPRRDRRLGRGRGRAHGLDVDADAVSRARHARRAVRAAGHARARDLPGRRRRLRPQGAAVRRGGDRPRALAAHRARRSSGSRTATRRSPRAATRRRSSASSRWRPTADGRFLALRGPLRRRRRRVPRTSVDEPHRPALRGLVPARACTTSRTSATRSTRPSRTSASRPRIAASAGRPARRRARR